MKLRVVVPPHPLIAHWLTMLRNAGTPAPIYATGLEELGRWLTYEAIREWLPYRDEEIETCQGKAKGKVIESRVPLITIPNMPGGLELWHGARKLLPNAQLWLGDLPLSIEKNAGIILLWDQITNGQLILETLMHLKKLEVGSERIRVVTALTSSQGLKKIGEEIPDLTIYTASIDPEIIDKNEISPGIGNPSIRLNTRINGPN